MHSSGSVLPVWRLTGFLLIGLTLLGTACSRGPSTVEVVFVGDIMLADGPGKAVARGVDPFVEFADLLHGADVAVGNLECVIATSGEKVEKPYNFEAHPRCIPVLKRYFHAVSAANNHSGDYGQAALVEQFERLSAAQLACFGGGRNLAEAHTPLVIERRGTRIALLGYNEFPPRSFEAGPDTPGIAWSVDEQVVADIQSARSKADFVIPFMHWGEEEEPEPCERQRTLARKMIDAGADVVVGSHPHVTQGTEYYRGHLIVYSLGNFVFDDFDDEPGKTGWILRLTFDRDGLARWDTRVAHMDEEGIPHPMSTPSPAGTREDTRASQ